MKTRSNMPLFVIECDNVKTLSNSQIDLLRCGDYLVKKDASGEHAYKVTYKKDKVGMCLTYHDASVIETQSYDYVDGNWVYNSEDKTELPVNEDLQDVIDDRVETLVEGGTLDNAKPVYIHPVMCYAAGNPYRFQFLLFNNDPTPIASSSAFFDYAMANFENGTLFLANGVYNKNHIMYFIKNSNTISFVFADASTAEGLGNAGVSKETFLTLFPTISDKVNKIN